MRVGSKAYLGIRDTNFILRFQGLSVASSMELTSLENGIFDNENNVIDNKALFEYAFLSDNKFVYLVNEQDDVQAQSDLEFLGSAWAYLKVPLVTWILLNSLHTDGLYSVFSGSLNEVKKWLKENEKTNKED